MASKHVHKLKRRKMRNGEQVYFCVLDCKYRIHVKEALGKKTICNRCGNIFMMDEYSSRTAKPRCPSCRDKKEDSELFEANIPIPKISTADEIKSELRSIIKESLAFPDEDLL